MKGTEKQIAFAERIKLYTITDIKEEIELVRADQDRGHKHIEAAIAAGDTKKADRVTETMNRLAKHMQALSIALLIVQRADDAAFILDTRDCPYNVGNNIRFRSYIRRAIANGYITAEEAEGVN